MENKWTSIFLFLVVFLYTTVSEAQIRGDIKLETKEYDCIGDSIGVDSLIIRFTVKSKSEISTMLISYGYIDKDTLITDSRAFDIKKIKGQFFIQDWQAIKIIYHVIRWNNVVIPLDITKLKLREVNFCQIIIYDNNLYEYEYFYKNSEELLKN